MGNLAEYTQLPHQKERHPRAQPSTCPKGSLLPSFLATNLIPYSEGTGLWNPPSTECPIPPPPNGVMPSSTFFFVQRISRLSHYTICKHQIKVNETESIRSTSLNKWKRKDFIVWGIAWEKQELIEPSHCLGGKESGSFIPGST